MRLAISTLLALLTSTSFAAPSPALDAETKTPYIWRIVLDARQHPTLTPTLRTQIARDIRVGLQPLLAEGGSLEIVDLSTTPSTDWQPLWKRYATDGWPALDAAEFRVLTGVKTHFVKVQVLDNGSFRLEARQHDGSTGLTSPLVRRKETTSGEMIGRLAGILVGKDFGAVGTVEPNPDDSTKARVRFRAGALGSFNRWVKEGDILAFAIIYKQPRPPVKEATGKPATELPPLLAGKPQEYTLLRVRTALSDGDCPCDVLTRFQQPFVTGKDVVGYRCMKLTTVDLPVRVRIVGTDGQPPPVTSPLEIWATDTTFSPTPSPRDSLERQDGLYRSGRALRGVACVMVRLGSTRLEPFPLPLLGGDDPITLRFAIDPKEVAKAEYEQACERFRGRAVEALSAQAELYRGLARLIQNSDTPTALIRATSGLLAVATAEKDLAAELERLKKLPSGDDYTNRLLASAADHLTQLRAGKPELEKKIADLQAVQARANDPAQFEREFRANELTQRIAYHVSRGEVPEALDTYDQLFEFTKEERAKTLKATLAGQWATKNDEHAKARKFLLEVWRKATTLDEMRIGAAALSDNVIVLEKNEDRLGLRLVLSSIRGAYTQLKEIVDRLDSESEADRPAIRRAKDVVDAIRKVEEAAQGALKKLDPPKE